MSFDLNAGPKKYAIRVGCERGLYEFVESYASAMGMSLSGAVRRLIILGARCEGEHGNVPMPTGYEKISIEAKEMQQMNKALDEYKD